MLKMYFLDFINVIKILRADVKIYKTLWRIK